MSANLFDHGRTPGDIISECPGDFVGIGRPAEDHRDRPRRSKLCASSVGIGNRLNLSHCGDSLKAVEAGRRCLS